MIDWAARSRHRYHTKLTKRLASAQSALVRAEAAPPSDYIGVSEMRIGAAKARIERAMKELRLWEAEHPDE